MLWSLPAPPSAVFLALHNLRLYKLEKGQHQLAGITDEDNEAKERISGDLGLEAWDRNAWMLLSPVLFNILQVVSTGLALAVPVTGSYIHYLFLGNKLFHNLAT